MPRRARVATAALALALAGRSAHAGDPTRVWRTIESAHFVISYYAPNDDVARRVADVAERAHATLVPALDHDPVKTQIVLVDDTDGANGFANVVPRNAITLFATGPTGSSNLSDFDDWLYTLVAHEYTHVVHLDTIAGLPAVVNKIVGKTWSQNQIQPRWVIEGIATYEESKRSSAGRNRNSTFDMYLRVPTLAGGVLRLDQVSAGPLAFPHGNAAYLYGSHFLRYIFDRFGDRSLREMSHNFGRDPIPFGVNRQIEHVVGKPFTELYGDWRGYLRDRAALQLEAVERAGRREGAQRTTAGENQVAPLYTPDGKELIWLDSDGNHRARIRAMPIGGTPAQARDLLNADRTGAFTIAVDGSLIYEQTQQFRRDYDFQDLMRWDPVRNRSRRLTFGARARDPVVSPDGSAIAFAQNGGSQSWISTMANQPGAPAKVLWRGARFEQAYTPAWSPDGTKVAFSAWRTGGYRDLMITEVATGATTELAHDRAVDGDPVWSPDGKWLYFDSDRTGITNIYARELATGALWQVTNVVGGAFEPAISPDGSRLAYHGFGAKGYQVFELALDRAAWTPAAPYIDERPVAVPIPDGFAQVDGPRPYRALETLAPLSFTTQLTVDSFGRAVSVQTGGSDIAGLSGWDLGATVGLERGDVTVGADYGWSGWRVPLRVAGGRNLVERAGYRIDSLNKTYLAEIWTGSVSVGVPGEVRSDRSWSASAEYDIDYERLVRSPFKDYDPTQSLPRPPRLPITYAGIAVRASYGNVRGFTYALGQQDGQDLSVSVRMDDPVFGADYRGITFSYGYRRFQRLWGPSAAVALRLSGGIHDGELPRTGFFGLGGQPDQDVVQSIIDSSRSSFTGYLHGYDARAVSGSQFHLLNLELRQRIADVERGVGTLPFYVRRVHAAALLDVGTAFDGDPTRDDVKVALGGVLRVDALFGYFVPGAFELGYAHGLTSDGVGQTWLRLTGTL
ncbi:MAG: DPP IV N-terminal domain-containing protein [Deltaproteobacteria bacterium]|nr:DPP IV N-terminal domain-containing protein [Deltaproteobacteria bacterium]